MPYIGQDLQVAYPTYLNIDDISGSFNGSTTSFALLVSGSAPVPLPLNSQQCLISVGGVIQRPDDSGTEGFRLSGGNIIFSSAPNTGEDFFGVILAGADYVNAGANFPDGQVGAPSITFDQDNDTGFYRSGSGDVTFSSNGVANSVFSSNSFTAPSFIPTSSTVPTNGVYLPAANSVAISTNGSERALIDSSGRLLVGTSSTSYATTILAQGNSTGSTSFGIYKACVGTASPADGVQLGAFRFCDSGHVESAEIGAYRDGGTWTSTTSQPTRLVFSTTADGQSAPTERMRITQAGYILGGTTDPNIAGGTASHTFADASTNKHALKLINNNSSFVESGGGVVPIGCLRSASSAYTFLGCYSGNSSTLAWVDKEFGLRGDGQAYADGSWNGGGADYAEYFEWADSNPDEEDRRGISVVLDGEKIREAITGEDPIGVISGNPSVVGDAAWNKWSGKYLRDEFGTYIFEDYEVEDEDGNTVVQQRRKLNPAYDPDAEYIPREQRPEWDCVGLMGKLRIRKGQVTGSRWIKMRDINDSVEEWLVR